jgi:hypothetical protein
MRLGGTNRVLTPIKRRFTMPQAIWVHWEGHRRKFELQHLQHDVIRAAVAKATNTSVEELRDVGMLWRHEGDTCWHSIPAIFDNDRPSKPIRLTTPSS